MKFEKAQHQALEEESKLIGEQGAEFEFAADAIPGQEIKLPFLMAASKVGIAGAKRHP